MFEKVAEVRVKVKGDYACFTRPEFKAERVSYPVITPSAARGVLEAIFWKPEIRFQIKEIWVLKLGNQMTILRNEISSRQGKTPTIIEDQRQQRCSLILKDVEYIIFGQMILRNHTQHCIKKYLAQFERRIAKGRCYHAPYLGNREFAASFESSNENDKPDDTINLPMGNMLFDIAFTRDGQREEMEFKLPCANGSECVKGYKQAFFFDANIQNGRFLIPQEKYSEIYQLEERND